jgi:hypothetical protein
MKQNLLLLVFLFLIGSASAQGTIEGSVFEDENADGIRQVTENAVIGMSVQLFNSVTNTPVGPIQNTVLGGSFSFTGLGNGSYKVRFFPTTANPDYKVSPKYASGAANPNDNGDDSDASVAAPNDTDPMVVTAAGETFDQVGLGVFLPGNINGIVWEDVNGDGLFAGEPALPSAVSVTLLDAATLTTVTTNASGGALTNPVNTTNTYQFNDLIPGEYIVEFSEPGGVNGLHLTKDNEAGGPDQASDDSDDSDADRISGRTFDITVVSDQIVNDIDAGYFIPGQVGNFVWEDENGNGNQDAEPGLGGITVKLEFAAGGAALDPDGNPIADIVTPGSGAYLFQLIPPGEYLVNFENPSGVYFLTIPDLGADNIDSDGDLATGNSPNFIIQSSTPLIDNIDAGYYEKCTIGDLVWHDLNGNGIQDAGEPELDGVDITITKVFAPFPFVEVDGVTAYTTMQTSAAAAPAYTFDNLTPGTYKLTFSAPTDFYFTQLHAGGDDNVDSDVDKLTNMTVNITCESGEVIENIDAGLYTKCSISNFVWEDLDGDGEQDAGEPGLNGVDITINDEVLGGPPPFQVNGTTAYVAMTTSGGGGNYIFDNLPPGTYKLTFTPSSPDYFYTEQDAAGVSDDDDSDVNLMGMTAQITCISDEVIENVDAGFFRAGSIEGIAWHDANADGIYDPTEPFLENVTFQLENINGPTLDVFGGPVPNQNSDASGFYQFTNLRPGTYNIIATYGAGWFFSPANAIGDPGDMPDVPDDSDFGDDGKTKNQVIVLGGIPVLGRSAGLYRLITLSGSIWGEDDDNSTLNPPEAGGNNVLVKLCKGPDEIAMTNADMNGLYTFANIIPGTYTVKIDASNFAQGGPLYGLSTCSGFSGDDDVDNDDNGDGPAGGTVTTAPINLFCGQEPEGVGKVENSTIDFCFKSDCGLPNPVTKPACEMLTVGDTICDLPVLEILCSRMPPPPLVGNAPNPLCNTGSPGGAPHNMSWFAFVAGAGNYTLQFDIFGCTGGQNAAQVGLFQMDDFCDFANRVEIYCQGGQCVTGIQSISSDLLVPGNTYFLWLDGCAGSVCSYRVDILGDFQQYSVPPIERIDCSSDFGRCDTICPNNTITFEVLDDLETFKQLKGAYIWTVTSPLGVVTEYITPTNKIENLDFGSQLGVYTIKAKVNIKCSLTEPEFTVQVVVANPPNENFGDKSVCQNELTIGWTGPNEDENGDQDPNNDGYNGWQGTPIQITGNIPNGQQVTQNVTTSNGCKFQQTVKVFKLFNSEEFIDTITCPGVPLVVGGVTFPPAIELDPVYLLVTKNAVGCDSLLSVLSARMGLYGKIVDVGCVPNGYQIAFQQDSIISIPSYFDGSYSYQFIWTNAVGNQLNDGDPDSDSTTVLITQSGVYNLTVIQTHGNSSCSFTFPSLNVDISNSLPDIATPASPWAPQLCADNTTYTYTATTTEPAANILSYVWTYPSGVNPIGATNTSSLTLNWGNVSGGNVCVSIKTLCGTSPPSCSPVQIIPIPVASLPVLPEICVDSPVSITAGGPSNPVYTYNWNFNGGNPAAAPIGPGPHLVSWGSAGLKDVELTINNLNCLSKPDTTTVSVVKAVLPPSVLCAGTLDQIVFTWLPPNGATGYFIEVTSGQGPIGILDGTKYTITGLAEGERVDIKLTTYTNSPCGNLESISGCITQNCNPPLVEIDPIQDICLTANTAPINLTTKVTPIIDGVKTFTGKGIIDPINGIFDPRQADLGANIVNLQYVDVTTCVSFAAPIIINVYETPTADFTANMSTICQDSFVTVKYTGNINGGLYNWTFGNDVVNPGAGQGPFNLEWNSTGNKNITLQVEKDGCISEVESTPVFVESRIGNVELECLNESPTSVTVGWQSTPSGNITGYTLKLDNAVVLNNSNNLTFTKSGLIPDSKLEFIVTANSNTSCPGTSDTLTCIANSCPPVTITFAEADTVICLDENAKPFPITAVITGGLGTGNGVKKWSGKGVDTNGIFDPNNAGPSTGAGHRITLIFEEGICKKEVGLNIKVNARPNSAFSMDDNICITDELNISFNGTSNQDFMWKLPTGVVITPNGSNKYKTKFNAKGTYKLGLIVGKNNCNSLLTENTVVVDPELVPVEIKCTTTLNSVEFTWQDIDCASEYEIIIDGVSKGKLTTNFVYKASNIAEGTKVTLEIKPTSECACPAIASNKTCEAKACPPIKISLSTPISKFCIGDVVNPIQLVATVQGSDNTGVGKWTGPGVSTTGSVNPALLQKGKNIFKYEFEEQSCNFDESITIDVFANPTITASVTNPICFNDNFGKVIAEAKGEDTNFSFRLDGNAITLADLAKVAPGNHILIVNDGNNCDASTNFVVTSAPEPVVEISGARDLLKGETTTLLSDITNFVGTIDSIVWTDETGKKYCVGPACKSIGYVAVDPHIYRAIYHYNGICFVQDTFAQDVKPIVEIILPNIIYPGSQSNGSFFVADYAKIDKINFMRIFDRWGNKVFTSEDFKPTDSKGSWNGKINNKDIVPGVYAYTIELTLKDGRVQLINGDVTVVK